MRLQEVFLSKEQRHKSKLIYKQPPKKLLFGKRYWNKLRVAVLSNLLRVGINRLVNPYMAQKFNPLIN